jgi:integrase
MRKGRCKMLPQEKVSELKDYGVYEDIQAFFEEFDQKSNDKRQSRNHKSEKSSTRLSYEKNIREFFKFVLDGKEIEHLTEDDLKLKKRDIINYRKKLQENGNANNTINQKMASVRSLFSFLNSEYEINTSIFDLKRLDETTNHYGIINQTEAELFAETAFQTEREKPFLKKLLILTAIRTSFRIDELLNLKWNSFELVDGVYKVSIRGKRNKLVTNAVSEKLYNEILKLKEENKETKWTGDPEIVFQITESAVNTMMKRLRTKLNISDERNVVFHSFRKVAINWELDTTGDVKKAAQQGNHSSIDVMYKNYIDHTRDYTQSAGVQMEKTIDLSFLDDLTIGDFKRFINQGNFKLQKDMYDFAKEQKLLTVDYILKTK